MFLTDPEGYQGVELLSEELLPPFQLTNSVVDPVKGGQSDVPRFVPEFVDLNQVLASLDQDSLNSIKALKTRFLLISSCFRRASCPIIVDTKPCNSRKFSNILRATSIFGYQLRNYERG